MAYVAHDLRDADVIEREREAVRELATACDLPFLECAVSVRARRGNAEANARRARYRGLETLARAQDASFVATGHHAHDQLETVLMRLARGSSARGLAGIRPVRRIGDGLVRVVRPMLAEDPAALRELCRWSGWAWREDSTNRDQSRVRAALRAEALPALLAAMPRIGEGAAASLELVGLAADVVTAEAERVLEAAEISERCIAFDAALLACESTAVVCEAFRLAAARFGAGVRGAALLWVARRAAEGAAFRRAAGGCVYFLDRGRGRVCVQSVDDLLA